VRRQLCCVFSPKVTRPDQEKDNHKTRSAKKPERRVWCQDSDSDGINRLFTTVGGARLIEGCPSTSSDNTSINTKTVWPATWNTIYASQVLLYNRTRFSSNSGLYAPPYMNVPSSKNRPTSFYQLTHSQLTRQLTLRYKNPNLRQKASLNFLSMTSV
jgi:hypothetical protein